MIVERQKQRSQERANRTQSQERQSQDDKQKPLLSQEFKEFKSILSPKVVKEEKLFFTRPSHTTIRRKLPMKSARKSLHATSSEKNYIQTYKPTLPNTNATTEGANSMINIQDTHSQYQSLGTNFNLKMAKTAACGFDNRPKSHSRKIRYADLSPS